MKSQPCILFGFVCLFASASFTARTDLQGGFGIGQSKDPGGPDSKCPVCDCNINHCDKGIKAHLDCRLKTFAQSTRIFDRKVKMISAVNYAMHRLTTNCNQFVSEFLKDCGYKGFSPVNGVYRTADDLHKFMQDKADSEGWDIVTAKEAVQHAEVGLPAIGIIDAETISHVKGVKSPGHIFIVTGKSPSSFSEDNPGVLNASQGRSLPERTTLNQVLSLKVREEASKRNTLHYYVLRPRR